MSVEHQESTSGGDMHPVVLIGGDHYNGLALVRLFGKAGYRPRGVIVGEHADSGSLRHSKYWDSVKTVNSDEEIVDVLLNSPVLGQARPVVIPWSDGAAATLDKNLDTLSKNFILPTIGAKQGLLYSLMDKGKQVGFARDCGLPMAESFELVLGDGVERPQDIPLPCIGKPIVSSEGEKTDIRKCMSRKELDDYLDYLEGKGYKRILIQEYVNIDAEYDVEGFVHGDDATYFAMEKIRTWPNVGGPTAYAFSINDPQLNAVMDRIVLHLKEMEFSGLFDVELFRVGDKFLFNEINWRNSAVCFAALASGVDYPLYWYQAVVGEQVLISKPSTYGDHAMVELLDFHNVVAKNVGIATWVNQLRGCKARAYLDPSDLKPVFGRYVSAVVRHLPFGSR